MDAAVFNVQRGRVLRVEALPLEGQGTFDGRFVVIAVQGGTVSDGFAIVLHAAGQWAIEPSSHGVRELAAIHALFSTPLREHALYFREGMYRYHKGLHLLIGLLQVWWWNVVLSNPVCALDICLALYTLCWHDENVQVP